MQALLGSFIHKKPALISL